MFSVSLCLVQRLQGYTGRDYQPINSRMFLALAVILAILWLLGVVTAYTLGGFIHLLLVLAIISLVYHFVRDTVDYRHDQSQGI